MVYAMRSKVLALLIICFCINITLADRWANHLHKRDGPTTPATITDSSTQPSSSPTKSGENNEGDKGSDSTTSQATKTSARITSASNSRTSSRSATSTQVVISAVTSNINGAAPTSSFNNDSSFNSTLTPQKLPLTPVVTPGFAVAGVFLMVSGAIYTLVGIRNKRLHIFLSAAYLASLAVTVLLLYIMNPPVSNAIQGAYVVAVVMTGLVLGSAAIVFKELTEGLGCLIGGFCLSMWLLVLKPGGLLTGTGAISGFIAAFTLVSFATSFSHITRPYALIFSISFAGATAVVLGIDCVSRAGLKEFWAYLFNLNVSLFPLGATTYPLTRGLRVEIAAIIVIFLAGIVSQMKLWKVIEKRREQRSSERLQDERTMEQEEENVGKRIERQNAQERDQWETVYGDKDAIKSTEHSNRDSGLGDMESKKGALSTVTSLRQSGEDEIEMADLSPTLTTGAGLVMNKRGQNGGPITVRVAQDVEVPQLDENGNPVEPRLSHVSVPTSTPNEQEEVWVVGADGEARLEKRPSQRNSKRMSNGPDVIPLPFKVLEGDVEDDRSSVATFADDEEASQKRKSRLSTGSALMSRISKRSHRNSQRFSKGVGNSTDDLVIPHEIEDDRASSVAATMDGLSDDEGTRSVRSSLESEREIREAPKEIQSPTSEKPTDDVPIVANTEDEILENATKKPISPATVGTDMLNSAPNNGKAEEEAVPKSLTSSTDLKAELVAPAVEPEKAEKPTPSVVSAVESKPASITKERLPTQLSKVVMSYRTNEWAKHLSGAEAPDLEELHLAEYPEEAEIKEVAAPVNVEELQQTPENALPPPARSMSQMSNYIPSPLTRSSSALSNNPLFRPQSAHGYSQDGPLSRSVSQPFLHSQPQTLNTRGLTSRTSSSPNIIRPIVESPIEEEFSASNSPTLPGAIKFSQNTPFGSTNTLMGKRDTMIRSRSYYANPSALSSTQEFQSTNPSSEAGSIYNLDPVDDDNMSLSARREMIRQSSLQSIATHVAPLQQTPIPFDSHQPRRLSSTPHPITREQQLASFRASVQNGFQSTVKPRVTIERQRSALWNERQAEEQKKAQDAKRREQRDSAFDERMRRGDMIDAHREALRKMQAAANKRA